jgi:hypothetical protein
MTQSEIKALASKIVGDGKSPNKWFVTAGPYCVKGEEAVILQGFDAEKDVTTYGPFLSREEALECYDGLDLDANVGIGQVFIEDRKTGTVKEKFLRAKVRVVYEEDEYSDF